MAEHLLFLFSIVGGGMLLGFGGIIGVKFFLWQEHKTQKFGRWIVVKCSELYHKIKWSHKHGNE